MEVGRELARCNVLSLSTLSGCGESRTKGAGPVPIGLVADVFPMRRGPWTRRRGVVRPEVVENRSGGGSGNPPGVRREVVGRVVLKGESECDRRVEVGSGVVSRVTE